MNIELQKAIAAARAGRRDQARSLVDSVLAAEPDNAHAWFLNSILAADEEEQVSSLTKVLELEPTHEVAQKRLAEIRAAAPVAPVPVESPTDTFEESEPFASDEQREPAETMTEAPPTVFDEVEPVTLPADTADADAWEEEGEAILASAPEPTDFDAQADGDSVPSWLADEGGYLPTEPALVVDEEDLVEEEKGDELPDWLQEEPADDWLQSDEIEMPFTSIADEDMFAELGEMPGDAAELAVAATSAAAAAPRAEPRRRARSKMGGLELLLIVLTVLAVLVVAALVYVIIASPL
jgi:hypothetical protein